MNITITVSGPSGSGKSFVCRAVMNCLKDKGFSVSYRHPFNEPLRNSDAVPRDLTQRVACTVVEAQEKR